MKISQSMISPTHDLRMKEMQESQHRKEMHNWSDEDIIYWVIERCLEFGTHPYTACLVAAEFIKGVRRL